MGAERRIDVMLSSTFRELVEHREAVLAAMNGPASRDEFSRWTAYSEMIARGSGPGARHQSFAD